MAPHRTLALAAALTICLPAELGAEALRFKCVYTKTFSPGSGLADAKGFALELALDGVTGEGVLFGNGGVSRVEAHPGDFGMTFIEKLATGAVQTTTIAKNGSSVHSRHTIFPQGDILPSQYYGKCN